MSLSPAAESSWAALLTGHSQRVHWCGFAVITTVSVLNVWIGFNPTTIP
jgi:hypothetical protein